MSLGRTFIGILLFCIVFVSHAEIPVYEKDYSRIRVGIESLSHDDPTSKMIFIGMDRKGLQIPASLVNPSVLGFQQLNEEAIEPLFVFFTNSKGIHQVYSFRIGDFRREISLLMPKQRGTEAERRVLYPEKFAALPHLLLNVQKPKQAQILSQLSRLFIELLTLTPVSIVAKPARLGALEIRHQRKTQLQLLSRLLHVAIRVKANAELREWVNVEALKQLDLAIEMSHGSLNTAANALFSNMEKQSQQFDKNETINLKRSFMAIKKIKEEAHKEGLIVIPFDYNTGMIAVDLETPIKNDAIYRLVPKSRIDEAREKYSRQEGGRLLGLSAFTTHNQNFVTKDNQEEAFYFEGLNLQNPSAQWREQKLFNLFKLIRSVGYGFLPGPFALGLAYGERGFGIVANLAEDKIGEYASRFTGKVARSVTKLFAFNCTDLSSLLAAVELGLFVPQTHDQAKFFAALIEYLEKTPAAKLSPDIKQQLLSVDSKTQADAIQSVLLTYLNYVDSTQYLLMRTSPEKRINATWTHARRFSLWSQSEHMRKKMNSKLSQPVMDLP